MSMILDLISLILEIGIIFTIFGTAYLYTITRRKMMKNYPKYIMLSQGIVCTNFKNVDECREYFKDSKLTPYYYQELDEKIPASWATGIFQVDENGNIGKCVSANWDSSD